MCDLREPTEGAGVTGGVVRGVRADFAEPTE